MKNIKNVSMFLLTILTLTLTSISSFAWPCCDCCPEQQSTLVSQQRVFTGNCELQQALQLARTEHTYPAMNGATLAVDYWQGAYSREASVNSVYQIDSYDCYGNLVNTRTVTQQTPDESVLFSVDNPNLHDDVSTSFAANAPMTNAEAQVAMNKAKMTCERAQ